MFCIPPEANNDLQGRLTNLQDIPVLAPYFFNEPDYSTDEARKLLKSLDGASYGTFAAYSAGCQGLIYFVA